MAPAPTAAALACLACAAAAEGKCHTAVKGEKCYQDIWWARHYGIVDHPGWYPGLTNHSSLEAFQHFLHTHKKGIGSCDMPCNYVAPAEAPESTSATPKTASNATASKPAATKAGSDAPKTGSDAPLRAVDPMAPKVRIDVGNASATMFCSTKDQTYRPADMLGEPFSHEDNVSMCQARCQMVVGCAHFSFLVPRRQCHLHGIEATAQPGTPDFISGPAGCREGEISEATRVLMEEMHSCLEAKTVYEPVHLARTVSSITECHLQCEKMDSVCEHFSFGLVSGVCRIVSGGATKVSAESFISGPPSCGRHRMAFMRRFALRHGHAPPVPTSVGGVLLAVGLAASVLGAALLRHRWRAGAGVQAQAEDDTWALRAPRSVHVALPLNME